MTLAPRHFLKFFIAALLTVVALSLFSHHNVFQKQNLTYGTNLSSKLSFIFPEEQSAIEATCTIPRYEGIFSLLRYIEHPTFNCSQKTSFGGGTFIKHLKYLSSSLFVDGLKYVCMDAGIGLERNSCVVYSFGINYDWSFDDDVAAYGCNVFSFDPTMETESHQRSDRVQFFRMGISGHNGMKKFGKVSGEVARLQDIMQRLGHNNKRIDYLKMDIEGNELDVFQDIFATSPNILKENVAQIGMEIHLVNGLFFSLKKHVKKYWDMLHQLECLGFQLANYDPNLAAKDKLSYRGKTFVCCHELLLVNTNMLVKHS